MANFHLLRVKIPSYMHERMVKIIEEQPTDDPAPLTMSDIARGGIHDWLQTYESLQRLDAGTEEESQSVMPGLGTV